MLERGKLDRGVVEIVDTEMLVPQDHLLRKIDAAVDFNRRGLKGGNRDEEAEFIFEYSNGVVFRCIYRKRDLKLSRISRIP